MYGVATDVNGLYYMRARYYNVAIKRFINQDVVDGSITNSQSLNKFSYVQGNPIRLTDPFGLCPDYSLTRIGHAALDLLGIILGFDGCDGINAGSRIIGNAGALIQSGGQALESAGNLYDSYVKDGEVISWKNATDLITLGLSVAGMGMAGKSLAKEGKALKAVSKGNVNVKPAAVSNSTGRSGADLQKFNNHSRLTIMSRNPSRGNPNAIIHFDAELNTRQNKLLNQLPDYDSSIIVRKTDVNLNDLSALTAKTGNEFAMFTRGSQRLIIRGGPKNVNIDGARVQELFEFGYKWSGHTHPGTGYCVKISSFGDKYILNIFKQDQSVIMIVKVNLKYLEVIDEENR